MKRPVDSETLVIGRIVSTPKLQAMPANTAAANDLDERLAGGYYRTAVVEIFGGITAIMKARVKRIESHNVVPGVSSYLYFNMTTSLAEHELAFDVSGNSSGVGVIPFHYVAGGTDKAEYSCLVGITGMLIAETAE